MLRKAFVLLLASALSIFSPVSASGRALSSEDVGVLIRAMLTMVKIWNAMHGVAPWHSPGTWQSSLSPYLHPRPAGPWGWNGLPPSVMVPGVRYPLIQPGSGLTGPDGLSPPAINKSHAPQALGGIWRGATGDVLVIQGHRFRIHNNDGFYRDGTFHVRGNLLVTYAPATGVTRHYELAQLGDRLALRDSAGQLFIFDRLRQSLPRYERHIIM